MDIILNFLFDNPYVPYVVGAIVLYVLYQKLGSRLSLRLPGGGLSGDAILAKFLGPRYLQAKVDREITRLKQQGNYLAAGRLLEENERLAEAIEVYSEGNEAFLAASLLEKLGKGDRAAELYIQAGDHKKAAQVLVGMGKAVKAAALFEEKGNNLEAARLYGLGSAWDKAAELYVKGGYPLRAAEAFEKTGEFRKAAECHEKHFMENVSYGTTYSATAQSPDQKSAFHAGRLYEQAGDPQSALQIYARGSYFKQAAAVSMGLGQYAKAAELFMRAEDAASAADAYDKAGDAVKAASLRGEVAFKADRIPEAAACFQQGRDYLRAAELYESVGMLAEAAGAYEAGDSFAAAGAVYIRAGLKERAAASYEKAGDYETAGKLYEEVGNGPKAAELFHRAGQTFKSGEAAARAGEREKAISLLQRVDPSDENYRRATELLARLFVEAKMPGLAIERVQRVLAGQPIGPSTLDLYYWLAAAHEVSGHTGEALEIYRKILAEDLQYRDVQKRIEHLRSATLPGRAPPAGAGGQAPRVAGVHVCPRCQRCFDDTTATCPDDQASLTTPRPVPHVLSDRYRLTRVLGEGGMGIVFEAHDQKLGRSVAIKVVHPEQLRDPSVRERLDREARAVARIGHLGVVGLYDSGELHDGAAFLVMELLKGRDLGDVIESFGRGTPAQVASLIRQAGAALTAAHRMGVIHRDVKPSNIFLIPGDRGFRVKVLDFGLAKSVTVDSAMTRSGMIVGTPGYMAPEQIQGPGVDVRSDLYSLGVVAYEALTRRRLVKNGELMTMLYTVLNDPPPPPSSIVAGLPVAVDQAFLTALAKDPAARPESVEAWVGPVAELLDGVRGDVAGWPDPIPPSQARKGIAGAPAAPEGRAAPAQADPAPQPHAAAPAAPASRFSLREELGRGPLGVVYRGADRKEGRDVALRELPPSALEASVFASLVQDLKAAAPLVHPNLVRVLGLVEVTGRRCVVTELVAGKNFDEALKAGHKLGFRQFYGLAQVLSQALSAIHGRGLVHGTVRPSNIMVAGGVVKLADLGLGGLARALGARGAYHPPEDGTDPRGDLYSMGAVLYHLLTGIHPRSQAQPPRPSKAVAGVPETVDRFLIGLLHPRPEQRFASADQTLQELAKVGQPG
jgi:serine/threonine protein kinase/tetratricopeptide (TPR) repeat protein